MRSRCLRLLRFVLSAFTYSELSFSSVAVVRDAIAAFSFAKTVITRETGSRSRTSTTSSTGSTVICVPRRPDKWAGELIVYIAGGTVVVC